MRAERTAVCACGQASITVGGEPAMQGACHCTNCKRRTGSAFGISSYFPRSAVVAIAGETCVYAFHHEKKAHDQRRHFCSRCGTTLYWYISSLPALIGVAGGCFAGQDLPAPGHSACHQQKEPWVGLPPEWKTVEG